MSKQNSVFAAHGLVNIAIMADTAAIIANPNANPNGVIYMVDDNASGGSTGEGTPELNTAASPGDTIIWRVYPIDGSTQVDFVAFKNTSGDVFGFNPPSGNSSQYQATVSNTGSETYQILIRINGTVQYSWDPFVTSSN